MGTYREVKFPADRHLGGDDVIESLGLGEKVHEPSALCLAGFNMINGAGEEQGKTAPHTLYPTVCSAAIMSISIMQIGSYTIGT